MLVDIKSLSVVDLLRSGALLVAFIATAFSDKRGQASVWIKADAVSAAAVGLALLIFPGILLGYMVDGETDMFHTYLARVGGAILLSIAVFYHLVIKDKDNAPLGSWIMSRTLGSGVTFAVFMLGIDTYGKGSTHFNQQFVSFGCLGFFLLFLGYVIHSLRYQDYVNEGRASSASAVDRTRLHLLVELLYAFPVIFIGFGFPQICFDLAGMKVDGIHIFLFRFMVCMFINLILMGVQVLQGNNEDARRGLLAVKLLGALLVIPLVGYYHFVQKLFPAPTTAGWVKLGMDSVSLLNAFVGAFYRPVESRKRK